MKKELERLLLVDASPLIYSVWNTVGKKLSNSKGEKTGLRFGFLRAVRSYERTLGADAVVICYDTPVTPKKSTSVSNYKSNREFTSDKRLMYDSVPALRDLLQLTKYTQMEAPGYEADDLIGYMARKMSGEGTHVYIVSTDDDMMQLVGPNVDIFMPQKSKQRAYFKDRAYCIEKYGVPPEKLLFYRAMAGDASDNLQASLHGFGSAFSRVIAQEAINKCQDDLNFVPKVVDGDDTSRSMQLDRLLNIADVVFRNFPQYGRSIESQEQFAENLWVMALHPPEELQVRTGLRDEAGLTSAFQDLEFKSLMKAIPAMVGSESSGFLLDEE